MYITVSCSFMSPMTALIDELYCDRQPVLQQVRGLAVLTCITVPYNCISQHVEVEAYVRPLSSTLMGSLPCSSASMSEGLQEWKAPLQMNRMWSVFTLPCFVCTTDPSMMGSRSLCTPSELASAPAQHVLHGQQHKAAAPNRRKYQDGSEPV